MNEGQAGSERTIAAVRTGAVLAVLFWALATASGVLASQAAFSSAFLPAGPDLVLRLAVAIVLAIAGAFLALSMPRMATRSAAAQLYPRHDSRLQALLASSFDCVVIVDASGRIEACNDLAARLFDHEAGNLPGLSLDTLLVPGGDAEPAGVRSVTEMIFDDVGAGGFEVTARSRDGRRFPAEIRYSRVANGAERTSVVALRETTSSIVARKALQHSERRYQALFDNILDGVYRCLPDGRLTAANPAIVRMLGYDSADELIGNANARDIYSDCQQRNDLLAQLDKHGEARNFQADLRRRDGNVITALANIRSISDEHGNDVAYEGTLTDITDLLRAQEALRDSEAHFRALSENALDVISVINAEGRIVYRSPSGSNLTGRPAHEQVGLELFRTVHPDDAETVSDMIATGFLQPGTSHRFTCRVYRHDGALRYLESVGTTFLARHGELRAVIHSRDVTERVATERELRDMQQLQVVGRMTDGLAHEFSNLLTVMSGNLELLDDSIVDESLRAHAQSALHACRQGSDLTRRLMAFAGRDARAEEEVNANGLLLDIEPILRRILSESTRLTTDYEQQLDLVSVQPPQLEGALLQLVVNARDAMPDHGTLTITTRNCPASKRGAVPRGLRPAVDGIVISISDTGRGMADDVLARATEPFFSTSSEIGRSGLGLSAVKSFVEAANGQLHICSQPGSGTTVHLFLPRAGANTPVSGGTSSAGDTVPRGCERVLVVDDDNDVRNATAALLSSLGYEVVAAANGEAALHLLQTEAVDLLFTDIAMPRLSGTELAAMARVKYPALKILFTSGNQAAIADVAANAEPRFGLIQKPFKKQRLAEKVRMALGA